MLFGQRIQQNQRERRLRKSQLYREMLDNQIRLNSEYRQSTSDSHPLKQTHTQKQTPTLNFYEPMRAIQKKPFQPLQNSFIYKVEKEQASRFLPVLKDSNKFMKGVSRFVKVEEPGKQRPRAEHFATEMIEEQDNDQYDQTCEKIIRDLQDIKNKPIKSRNRRKLYGGSDMQFRGQRLHTDPHQPHPQTHDRQFSNQRLTANYQSLKPETRYAKFQPLQSKLQRQQLNEFAPINLGEESKMRKHLPALNQSGSPPQISINSISAKGPNAQNNSKLASHSTLAHQGSAERQKESSIGAQAELGRSLLQNRDRKGNNSVSYTQSKHERKNEAMEANTSAASTAKLQLQRQTFLQLLRKVKNRGESLYLKLAKFPNEKSPPQQ